MIYFQLVGGIPTPMRKMSSSVGMMTFPTEWKKKIQTTNQHSYISPLLLVYTLLPSFHITIFQSPPTSTGQFPFNSAGQTCLAIFLFCAFVARRSADHRKCQCIGTGINQPSQMVGLLLSYVESSQVYIYIYIHIIIYI